MSASRATAGSLSFVAVAATVAFALIGLAGPQITFQVVFVAVLVAAAALRLEVALALTIFLAFTAVPEGVPLSISVGGFSLWLFEPFLLISALHVFATRRRVDKAAGTDLLIPVGLFGFLAFIALGVGVGISNGSDWRLALSDIRAILPFALAVIVASGTFGVPRYGLVLVRTLKTSLVLSAFFIVLAAAGLLTLSGRVESAQLWSVNGAQLAGASDSLRLLSSATFVAVASLIGWVAASFYGWTRRHDLMTVLVPSLIIVVLAYSRNNLVAVAVGVIAATVGAIRTDIGYGRQAIRRLLIGAASLIIAVALASLLPSDNALSSTLGAYSSRVLEGLNPNTQAIDSSTQDRVLENSYMLQAIASHPFFGTGFGYAYRPAFGVPGSFTAFEGQYYGHNYYLWLLMKGGVGALLFLSLTIAGVVALIFAGRISPKAKIAGAVLLGLFSVMGVAPLLSSPVNATVVGLALGAILAFTRVTPPAPASALMPLSRRTR